MASAAQLVKFDQNYCVSRWQHVLLMFWRGVPSTEGVLAGARAMDSLLEEHPSIGTIFVLEPHTHIPHRSVVQASVQHFKKFGSKIEFRAGIVELEGVTGDLMRAVVRTVTTLAPQDNSTFVPDVRAASVWLAPRLKTSAPEMREMIEGTRSAYDRALR